MNYLSVGWGRMLHSRINKTSVLFQQKLRDAVMLNTGRTEQRKHLLLSVVLRTL